MSAFIENQSTSGRAISSQERIPLVNRPWLSGFCFCGNFIPQFSNAQWCDDCLDLYAKTTFSFESYVKANRPHSKGLQFITLMKLFRLMSGR